MLPFRPFYFLRHGETDFNREHRVAGHIDVPLNCEGRAQAADAARRLGGASVSRIVHSPLVRAAETARIVATTTAAPLAAEPGLAECRWGEMEGRITEPGDYSWVDAWQRGETPSGAETYVEFRSRALTAIAAAIASEDDGRAVLVSHGGVYRILREALGHAGSFSGRNAEPLLCEPPARPGQPWRIVPVG